MNSEWAAMASNDLLGRTKYVSFRLPTVRETEEGGVESQDQVQSCHRPELVPEVLPGRYPSQ